MRPSSFAACTVALALGTGLAACSNNSSGSGSASSVNNLSAVTAGTDLITSADVPSGWSTAGKTQTGMSAKLQSGPAYLGFASSALSSCIGVSTNLNQNLPEASGATFNSSDGNQSIAEAIDVFPNASAARTLVGTYADPKAPGCLNTVLTSPSVVSQLQSTLPKGSTLQSVTVQPRSLASLGDVSVDLEMAITGTANGQQQVLYVDYVLIAKGPLAAGVTFTSATSVMPIDTVSKVAGTAAGDLPAS